MKNKTLISFLSIVIMLVSLSFILGKSLEIPQDLPLSIELVHNDKFREANLTHIYHQELFKKSKVWTTENNHKLEDILAYLNKPSTVITYDLDSTVIIAPLDAYGYKEINLYKIKEDYLTFNNIGLINLDLAEKMPTKMEIKSEKDMIYVLETVLEKSILGINVSTVKAYYMFLVR